jgi:hypothetical protein
MLQQQQQQPGLPPGLMDPAAASAGMAGAAGLQQPPVSAAAGYEMPSAADLAAAVSAFAASQAQDGGAAVAPTPAQHRLVAGMVGTGGSLWGAFSSGFQTPALLSPGARALAGINAMNTNDCMAALLSDSFVLPSNFNTPGW